MTQGVKTSQNQIEGKRRQSIKLRNEKRYRFKFPIVKMTLKESIPFLVIFVIAAIITSLL